jgi:hypothetical protein
MEDFVFEAFSPWRFSSLGPSPLVSPHRVGLRLQGLLGVEIIVSKTFSVWRSSSLRPSQCRGLHLRGLLSMEVFVSGAFFSSISSLLMVKMSHFYILKIIVNKPWNKGR